MWPTTRGPAPGACVRHADTGTAHKLARMVDCTLTCSETYVDQGQQHYKEEQRQRSVVALKRRANALGFAVMPTTTAA